MTDFAKTTGGLLLANNNRYPRQFLWGMEYVQLRAGAGSLFEKLYWLNSQLGEAPILRLRDRNGFWSPDTPCLGVGDAAVVAAYFLFESKATADLFVQDLDASLPVRAEIWTHRSAIGPGEQQACSVLVLFDVLEPIHGPMGRCEALRAVQHYLGWCSKSRNEKPWRCAKSGTVELVPVEANALWFAARQPLLQTCMTYRLLEGKGFTCETPCRD